MIIDEVVTQLATAIREAPADRLEDVLRVFVETVAPCQSCGADPSVSPASGEELPIVKGALDAQAAAEQRADEWKVVAHAWKEAARAWAQRSGTAVLDEREVCIAEIEHWWRTPQISIDPLIDAIRRGEHRDPTEDPVPQRPAPSAALTRAELVAALRETARVAHRRADPGGGMVYSEAGSALLNLADAIDSTADPRWPEKGERL